MVELNGAGERPVKMRLKKGLEEEKESASRKKATIRAVNVRMQFRIAPFCLRMSLNPEVIVVIEAMRFGHV